MAETPKDFIDIDKPSAKNEALAAMRDAEKRFTKLHKPYDRYGAMMDFEDLCADYERKLIRAHQRKLAIEPFKNTLKWDDYGKNDRFELVGETEEFYTNMKTGHVTPRKMIVKTYLAKSGGKVTVTYPADETKPAPVKGKDVQS